MNNTSTIDTHNNQPPTRASYMRVYIYIYNMKYIQYSKQYEIRTIMIITPAKKLSVA